MLGNKEEKETVLKGISAACGFMRRELKGRLSLKYIPELSFHLDESMEEAQHIQKLIDRLSKDEPTSSSAEGISGASRA